MWAIDTTAIHKLSCLALIIIDEYLCVRHPVIHNLEKAMQIKFKGSIQAWFTARNTTTWHILIFQRSYNLGQEIRLANVDATVSSSTNSSECNCHMLWFKPLWRRHRQCGSIKLKWNKRAWILCPFFLPFPIHLKHDSIRFDRSSYRRTRHWLIEQPAMAYS